MKTKDEPVAYQSRGEATWLPAQASQKGVNGAGAVMKQRGVVAFAKNRVAPNPSRFRNYSIQAIAKENKQVQIPAPFQTPIIIRKQVENNRKKPVNKTVNKLNKSG